MTTLAERIAKLKELEEKATPGEWRPGRPDARSFDGVTGEEFKNVYSDDDRGGEHLGQRIPFVVAIGKGDPTENAELIAYLRNNALSIIEELVAENEKLEADLDDANIRFTEYRDAE